MLALLSLPVRKTSDFNVSKRKVKRTQARAKDLKGQESTRKQQTPLKHCCRPPAQSMSLKLAAYGGTSLSPRIRSQRRKKEHKLGQNKKQIIIRSRGSIHCLGIWLWGWNHSWLGVARSEEATRQTLLRHATVGSHLFGIF